MSLLRAILITLVVTALFAGCTSIKVRPVSNPAEVKHVCIEDGRQNCFEGRMIDIIRDGFQRHSITSDVYSGNLPPECGHHLTYYCERTWDMVAYMHHAELRLYRGKEQIGYAEYHLVGKGGLSPMKWQDTKTKMDPVIDELLGNSKVP
jgi:hypothetical protein